MPTGPLRWSMPMLELGEATLVTVTHIISKVSTTCVTGPGWTMRTST